MEAVTNRGSAKNLPCKMWTSSIGVLVLVSLKACNCSIKELQDGWFPANFEKTFQ